MELGVCKMKTKEIIKEEFEGLSRTFNRNDLWEYDPVELSRLGGFRDALRWVLEYEEDEKGNKKNNKKSKQGKH